MLQDHELVPLKTPESEESIQDDSREDWDFPPHLPIQKELGETVISLHHVKKGPHPSSLHTLMVHHIRVFPCRKRRCCKSTGTRSFSARI